MLNKHPFALSSCLVYLIACGCTAPPGSAPEGQGSESEETNTDGDGDENSGDGDGDGVNGDGDGDQAGDGDGDGDQAGDGDGDEQEMGPLLPFTGIVHDEEDAPIAGATVAINGATIETSDDGSFMVMVEESERYVINADDHGYVPASIIHAGGNIEELRIELQAAEVFMIDPTQAIDVIDSRGTRIELPPDAIVNAMGDPVDALIELHMYTYDVANEDMVGDMSAIDADNQEVTLFSIGAFSATFVDADENEYQLAPDVTAQVTAVATPEFDSGPIPMWFYDEEAGVWLEEGEASVLDGVVTAEVPHFSAWNFDYKINPACIYIDVPNKFPNWFKAIVKVQNPQRQRTIYLEQGTNNKLYNLPPNAWIDIYAPPGRDTPAMTINSGPSGPCDPANTVTLEYDCQDVFWQSLDSFPNPLAPGVQTNEVRLDGLPISYEWSGGPTTTFTHASTIDGMLMNADSQNVGWTGGIPAVFVQGPNNVLATMNWDFGGTAAARFGPCYSWLVGIAATSGINQGPVTLSSSVNLSPYGQFDAFNSGTYPVLSNNMVDITGSANQSEDGYSIFRLEDGATQMSLSMLDGANDQFAVFVGAACDSYAP